MSFIHRCFNFNEVKFICFSSLVALLVSFLIAGTKCPNTHLKEEVFHVPHDFKGPSLWAASFTAVGLMWQRLWWTGAASFRAARKQSEAHLPRDSLLCDPPSPTEPWVFTAHLATSILDQSSGENSTSVSYSLLQESLNPIRWTMMLNWHTCLIFDRVYKQHLYPFRKYFHFNSINFSKGCLPVYLGH